MELRRIVLAVKYKMRRINWSTDTAYAPHTRKSLDGILRVPASQLHVLPVHLVIHTISPDVGVPEPLLLRLLPDLLGKLEARELANISPRDRRALDAKILLMVTADLAL